MVCKKSAGPGPLTESDFCHTHNNTTPGNHHGKVSIELVGKVSIGLACHPNHNHHEEVVDAEQKPHHQT